MDSSDEDLSLPEASSQGTIRSWADELDSDDDVIHPPSAFLAPGAAGYPGDGSDSRLLLKAKAPPLNERDSQQLRELIVKAARCGYLQVLDRIKERGLVDRIGSRPFDFCDNSKQAYSPLMHACEGKHVDVVQFLLDNGAHVFYTAKSPKGGKTNNKVNAVHMVCCSGDLAILKLLLTAAERKGDLNKTSLNSATKDGLTPFMYALKYGNTTVMDALLETGLVDLTTATKKGQNVFHTAARMQRLDYLKKLHHLVTSSETDEDPLYAAVDKSGWNIVHHACAGVRVESHECHEASIVEVLQWLFENVPSLTDPEILNAQTKSGYTPLLCACQYQKAETVRALLGLPEESSPELGIPPGGVRIDLYATDTTKDGAVGLMSGLHIAAIHDSYEIASALLLKGCSLDIADAEGNTALHIAVKRSSQRVEELLRKTSSPDDLSVRNKAGLTPSEVEPEDVIPVEIKKEGPKAIEVYKLAIRKGKTKIPRCNFLILGQERMGKTSLLSLLLGRKFNPDQDHTHGIDNTVVDTVDNRSINPSKWAELDRDHQVRDNAQVLAGKVAGEVENNLPKKEEKDEERQQVSEGELLREVEEIAKRYSEPELDSSQLRATAPSRPVNILPQPQVTSLPVTKPSPSMMTRILTTPAPTLNLSRPVTRRSPPTAPSKPTPMPRKQPPLSKERNQQQNKPLLKRPLPPLTVRRQSSGIGRHHAALIGKQLRRRNRKVKEPSLHLNTYDFAGQKEYRPMHHCFIVRRAIYLVVFNLQLVLQFLQGKLRNPNPLEEIRYWLNSIHAHIHISDEDDKRMKTAFLVGTHRAPKNPAQGRPIRPEELSEINKVLREAFFTKDEHDRCVNHLHFVPGSFPTHDGKLAVFTDVENSMDGEDEREASGAAALQAEICRVCGVKGPTGEKSEALLPFLRLDHPLLWLQFEDRLRSERDQRPNTRMVVKKNEVIKIGERCGIAGGEDIDTTLKFFHNTGSIVLLKELPTVFLKEWERKELENLVLLDPKWLIKVMKEIMELLGRDCHQSLSGADIKELETTGKAKESLLRECWKGYYDEEDESSFRHLCLMLQAYGLIYPIEGSHEPTPPPVQPSQSVPSDPVADSALHVPQPIRSQSEDAAPPHVSRVFLVPCKLPPAREKERVGWISYYFDFCGFLPAEVYHRFICQMLRESSKPEKSEFSETWCVFHDVVECRLLKVQVEEEKHLLVVSVMFKPEERNSKHPSTWLRRIHDHLLQICENSGLKGLTYKAGPWLENCCNPRCMWDQPAVFPVMSYPKKEYEMECNLCLITLDVDLLLNPEYRKPSGHQATPDSTQLSTRQATAVPTATHHSPPAVSGNKSLGALESAQASVQQQLLMSNPTHHSPPGTKSLGAPESARASTQQQLLMSNPTHHLPPTGSGGGWLPGGQAPLQQLHPQSQHGYPLQPGLPGLPVQPARIQYEQLPQPAYNQPLQHTELPQSVHGQPQQPTCTPQLAQRPQSAHGQHLQPSHTPQLAQLPQSAHGQQHPQLTQLSQSLPPNPQGIPQGTTYLSSNAVHSEGVGNSRLTARHLPQIADYLKLLRKPKITELGVQLGLSYTWLEDNKGKENFHLAVGHAWLNGQDNVEQTCPPTWKNFERTLRSIGESQVADRLVAEQLHQPQ